MQKRISNQGTRLAFVEELIDVVTQYSTVKTVFNKFMYTLAYIEKLPQINYPLPLQKESQGPPAAH